MNSLTVTPIVDPVAKAAWVLTSKGIAGVPAFALGDIAGSEGIKFKCKPYPDKWDGMLVFKGKGCALLVNTRVGSPERHNFTFAHELGHYFLLHPPTYSKEGQTSIRCILGDTGNAQQGREAEANRFAATLLMPETLFRPFTMGAPLDFTLIDSLAREFQVSKHACSNRILDFTREPYAVINSRGFAVTACKLSRAARGYLHGLKEIPDGTAARAAISAKRNQQSFAEGDPQIWQAKSNSGLKLYEWTKGNFNKGVAMTILRWQGI